MVNLDTNVIQGLSEKDKTDYVRVMQQKINQDAGWQERAFVDIKALYILNEIDETELEHLNITRVCVYLHPLDNHLVQILARILKAKKRLELVVFENCNLDEKHFDLLLGFVRKVKTTRFICRLLTIIVSI